MHARCRAPPGHHRQGRRIHHAAIEPEHCPVLCSGGLQYAACPVEFGGVRCKGGMHRCHLCRVDAQLAAKTHAPAARGVVDQTLKVLRGRGHAIDRRGQSGAARGAYQCQAHGQQFGLVRCAVHAQIDLEVKVSESQTHYLGRLCQGIQGIKPRI